MGGGEGKDRRRGDRDGWDKKERGQGKEENDGMERRVGGRAEGGEVGGQRGGERGGKI